MSPATWKISRSSDSGTDMGQSAMAAVDTCQRQHAAAGSGSASAREASHHGEPLSVRLWPSTELGAAAEIWQAVENRVDQVGLTCSWDWTETWLSHYGDLVPHFFAIAERAGEPCGIALITHGVGQKRGPFPIRTIHVGTAGEPPAHGVYVEYNRLLVAHDERDAFAQGLMRTIRASNWTWDELMLDGFTPDDAAPFLDQERRFVPRREPCPAVDLDAIRANGSGEVLTALRKGTRYNVRRSLRGFGPVDTEWAETPEHAADILDELIALHQHRWTQVGQAGAFSSDRFERFHRMLIPRLLTRKAAILYRARNAEGTIGCLYSFVDHGNVLFYQSGLGQFGDEKLKPGLVVHTLCMQGCLERGLREYNYLQGEARYKRELATTERELIWAVAARPTVKGRAISAAQRARRRLARRA